MDRRTKFLAGALCGLIVLWGDYKLFYKWGYEPILQKEAQITAREEALDDQHHDLAQLARAKKQLKDWTEQSLPPDKIVAHNLYYNWLTGLAVTIGFDDLKIAPGNSQTVVLGKGKRKKKPLQHAVHHNRWQDDVLSVEPVFVLLPPYENAAPDHKFKNHQ